MHACVHAVTVWSRTGHAQGRNSGLSTRAEWQVALPLFTAAAANERRVLGSRIVGQES